MGELRALLDSGVPIWVIGTVMVLIAAGMAVPKVLGPVGELIERWTTASRRAVTETEKAETEARALEISEAREQRDRARVELAAAEDRIWQHRAWDQRAMAALPDDWPPPPPLLPGLVPGPE